MDWQVPIIDSEYVDQFLGTTPPIVSLLVKE